jgi:hypothetical protein
MVRIKFSTHPRIPAISPSISLMASENVGIVSAEHKESSTERLDTSFAEKEPVGSTEMTSKLDAQSDESEASDDTGDSGNASDNGGRVKVGAEAALARMSFDFGQSKVTKGCVSDLESSSCFSPKGLLRLLGIESVMVPREDEVVVFEDFFCCQSSYTSAPYTSGYSSQISGATTSTDSKCHSSNQQIYLGCYVL